MGGSQVYLKHGERFSVEDLLMALAVHSANDAAVALAEHHSGSTEAFVDLMNIRAQELGLHQTVFRSVHGLPPDWGAEPDLSTAHDLAQLGRILVAFDDARRWAATATAPFREGEFTLYNPNKLIGRFRGIDGIKTGHHQRAGYCVTASATRQQRRLIAVVMGCTSDEARATETTRLLSYGFNLFTQVTLVDQPGTPCEAAYPVKGGKERVVPLAYADRLAVSVRRDQTEGVLFQKRLPNKIPAPIAAGDEVGKAVALLDGRTGAPR
jgi:D-alanyl-D-alanine carboxypeptidase (penicillin-binding protein 5/6)